MKTSKKIFLEFRQNEFNNAVAQFGKKQIARNELLTELSILINAPGELTESIEADPMQFYNAWLLNEYQERNPMNLNANKLIDLLEIDLTNFKNAIVKNNAIPNIPEPIEEDFKIYAETPEEMARFKLANDLVDVIQRTKKICGFVNLASFKPIIFFDGGTNEYAVNKDFIKSKFAKNVL